MHSLSKATRIELLNFSSPAMRAFHMAWIAFFLCFFAWFGIAPLMTVVREEMQLTKDQIGWCLIGSVAITIIARIAIGWVCDRIGPRLAFTGLLLFGSLPVMGIALANDFTSFLFFRVLIGAIGASFVVTQYHMSVMFAPQCVGTANATTAGWGNLGGGVTQMAMPLLFAFLAGVIGLSNAASWRLSMVIAGLLCIAASAAYYLFTQDTPEGNYRELRAAGKLPPPRDNKGAFWQAARDYRVWALLAIYGACFGIELSLNNVAVLYLVDYFPELKAMEPAQALKTAGLVAGICGSLNLFARALGGIVADKFGKRWGLAGRAKWLFLVLLGEGLALMFFAQSTTLLVAIPALVILCLFVDMACGATFAVVPFVNPRALGAVAGLVGAGGNAGAVASGFLFKHQGLDWSTALFLLGAIVTACSFLSFAVTARAEEAAPAPQPADPSRNLDLAAAS